VIAAQESGAHSLSENGFRVGGPQTPRWSVSKMAEVTLSNTLKLPDCIHEQRTPAPFFRAREVEEDRIGQALVPQAASGHLMNGRDS
jgi:hypothetical protein